jgi:hypothetical protein
VLKTYVGNKIAINIGFLLKLGEKSCGEGFDGGGMTVGGLVFGCCL